MKKTINPDSNSECYQCEKCLQLFGYDKDCEKHEKTDHKSDSGKKQVPSQQKGFIIINK